MVAQDVRTEINSTISVEISLRFQKNKVPMLILLKKFYEPIYSKRGNFFAPKVHKHNL